MKARHIIFTVIFSSTLTPTVSHGETRGKVQKKHNDPIPQFMVQNFFNILIQGGLAVTAEKGSENQREAVLNVLNSISNLAQLACKSSNMRMTDEEHDLIQQLSAKLYKACINNPLFMGNLNKKCTEAASQLAKIMSSFEPAEHHSEHEQIDLPC